MNKRNMQSGRGFSAVELVVVLAIVGLIGGAGAYVYSQRSDGPSAGSKDSNSNSTATASDVPEAPAIQSASDLDSANTVLDQTNLDASDADTQELEQNLANL